MHFLIKTIDEKILEFDVQKDSCIIGRSSRSDIVIAHEGVSRQHCLIELKDNEIYVTDLQSINGVFIGDNKIEPGVSTHYPIYLNLSFGSVQSLQIELDSPKPINHLETDTPQKTKSARKKVSLVSVTRPAPGNTESTSGRSRILIMSVMLLFGLSLLYYLESDTQEEYVPTPEELYED
jgi:pSer/pThr/pTyr-binding forkhead associated (FHA) protein